MRDRIESVQAMRGVAALGVVVLHAREAVDRQGFIDHPLGSTTTIGEWANLGAVGVDLFFVISGFVMARSVAKLNGWAGVRRFALGRLTRIVPLFWLLSLPMLAWWLSKGAPLVSLNALNTLTFVPLHAGPYAFPFHGVGWTLSFEFVFYGLVAAVIAAPRDRRALWLLAMLSTLALLPLRSHPFAVLRWISNPIMLEFGFGVLAYILWDAGKLERYRRALAVGAACAVGLLAVYHVAGPAAVLTPNGVTHQGLGGSRALFVGLPCFALFLWALPFGSLRRLVQLGEASYSLYLVHPPVMVAAGYLLPRSIPGDVAFALLVLASLAAGALVWKSIEEPLQAYFEARLAAPRTASAASSA